MEKTKNFEEFNKTGILKEGMWGGAEWVDLELLQNTIERMRSDEYKKALAELNSKFPITGIKVNLPGES
jgi:hypothetical protein